MISNGNGISVEAQADQQTSSESQTKAKEKKVAAAKETAARNKKTVYVTKSGSKYHTSDCYMLKSSPRSLTEEEALTEGYEPCSKCKP